MFSVKIDLSLQKYCIKINTHSQCVNHLILASPVKFLLETKISRSNCFVKIKGITCVTSAGRHKFFSSA